MTNVDIEIENHKIEYIKSSNTYLIDGKFQRWDLLLEQLTVLKSKYDISPEKIPFWVKGYTTFGDMIDSYESQNRKFKRQLAKDVKKAVKKLLRKSENNRFQNTSREKLIDNLRYAIARRYNCASSNLMPIGYYDILYLALLDRGNVLEYSKLNFKDDFMKTNQINQYTKKEVIDLYTTLKDEYDDKTPKGIIDKLESFKDDTTTTKYSLHDLLGDEGLTALRNEVIPFHVLVADKVICITEMKNFNGKSNPWEGPHYLFQYLNTYNNYDCDILFQQLETTETKDASTGKMITHDGLQNLKTHFGDSFKKCPEVVPALAIVHRAYKKDINNFNSDIDIFDEDRENQIETFINLFKGMGRVTSRAAVDEMYKAKFSRKSDYAGTEKEDVKTIKAMDTHITNKSLNDTITKLNNFCRAVELVRKNEGHNMNKNAHSINVSLVKKLIQKDSIRTLISATLAALGSKFGEEKSSESNVTDFLSMYCDNLTGDRVFTVETDSRGNSIGYEILSTEWEESIKQQGGKSNDWNGKGTILYDCWIETWRKFEETIGLDDGDNPELAKKEIKFLMEATGEDDCYWYESDTYGIVGKRGVKNKKRLPLTSIEHGDDTKNNWETIYFEDTSQNSAKKRAVKPSTKVSGYKMHLETQQMLLDEGKITSKQLKRAVTNLEDIINHWELIETKETEGAV